MIIELNAVEPRFEPSYKEVRAKENRLLSDEQVLALPGYSAHHQQEWKIRNRSARTFLNYLNMRFDDPFAVLEVGCGNGWFAHQLSTLEHARTLGLDINKEELKQADRLFGKKAQFFLGDMMRDDFQFPEKVDIIIFNASFQYFSDGDKLLNICRKMLKKGGEIHVLDTPFYHPFKLKEARERSTQYFNKQGVSSMTSFYHHHSTAWIQAQGGKIHLSPSSRLKKLLGKHYPFYWVSFT